METVKIEIEITSELASEYLRLKEQYSDSLLLYRLGDFYEVLFEDAKIISNELDLTLTSRPIGPNNNAYLCGIPYFKADDYIALLVKKGFRVAIAEGV